VTQQAVRDRGRLIVRRQRADREYPCDPLRYALAFQDPIQALRPSLDQRQQQIDEIPFLRA
jgi:hypothetical protein